MNTTMKTTRRILALIATAGLSLVGCGGSSTPTGTRYELWVQGTHAEQFQAAIMNMRSVSASANNKTLTTQLQATASKMDLSADRPYLVGYVWVPKEAQEVSITAAFDDFGGYQRGNLAGSIDSRTTPVRFTAPVADLQLHGHAVVRVDLEQSLSAKQNSDERLLLANTVIGY